ncbi:hypothetical protein GCM10009654_02600 [Streptomyces hebeiensis]|uniref:Uncharacterized protein n=1 Tax=Streptomyces hebeiensis TaxID=229486 RepID=A0ABN1UGK5_9ACTN
MPPYVPGTGFSDAGGPGRLLSATAGAGIAAFCRMVPIMTTDSAMDVRRSREPDLDRGNWAKRVLLMCGIHRCRAPEAHGAGPTRTVNEKERDVELAAPGNLPGAAT